MNSAGLIALKAMIECFCRCQGYTAENQMRTNNGHQIAYDHDAYAREIDFMNEVWNNARDWVDVK